MSWRIYLVGAGAIAHQHAIAAGKLEDAELFAADPSPAARDAFRAAFPHATVFEDAEVMLASSPAQDHDVVVLAVPPWLHHTAGLSAFRSGRHVLSEKPVARSQAELDDLLDAAKAAGRRLGDCSVRFLGNEALARGRDIISSGGIGSPYHARLVNRRPRSRPGVEYQPQSGWFLDKEKSGGGAIFDWGVYDLAMFFDVLRPVSARIHQAWLATPKTGIDPEGVDISIETHAGAAMTLELETGAIVTFDYERGNGFHGEPQSLLNVDGTDGGLTWQWTPPFEDDRSTLTHYVDVEGKVVPRVEKLPGFGWDSVHARPLLAFADLIEGRDSVILPEARLAFNFAVMSAIYECASSGLPVSVTVNA
ncbi:hypothetical protein A6U87_26060 [Rhizobium sp. AC44/96]|uniref:Gfo/Idh/MocA family protein n=1 Tax=Rhizobium sp. AC44/96 TaxID=1841654 RepID=UPI00080FD7F4|nr:Gfo/Idh/MocA family oxidoreductase [Rhizobium sp. AC44/96]OCJ14422.1 hypothetical protein A6U87_26060 [Rhizobium sp. AC44/96]